MTLIAQGEATRVIITLSGIPAVTQVAKIRSLQVINEESSTVAHFDLSRPRAAAVIPMETDFSLHRPLGHFGMSALHPAGGVGPTMLFGGTLGCNLVPSFPGEPVPSRLQVPHVTFEEIVRAPHAHGALFAVEDSVRGALWWGWKQSHVRTCWDIGGWMGE